MIRLPYPFGLRTNPVTAGIGSKETRYIQCSVLSPERVKFIYKNDRIVLSSDRVKRLFRVFNDYFFF